MKWEYKYVFIHYRDPIDGNDCDTQLNAFGEDGWELVTFYPSVVSPGVYQCVFKRPKYSV